MSVKRMLVGLLAVLGACAARPRIDPVRVALVRAQQDWERGDLPAVVRQSDAAAARLERGSAPDAARLFAAGLLAARAHARAASVQPFLTEPDGTPSPVAHLVALTFHARAAREAAALAPVTQDVDVERGLAWLYFAELAAHTRLGFESSAARALAGRPELATLAGLEQAFDGAQLEAALQVWVYLALFESRRATDELEAFRFGAHALDRAVDGPAELTARVLGELERWTATRAANEFHCPKCDLPVRLRLRACPADQTPNVEFVARPK